MSMLWKDLTIGFLVGGLLSAFMFDAFWKTLFLTHASPWSWCRSTRSSGR
jgi:hypothetical protein